MSEIYRLVYTSRNLLQGVESERASAVAKILATSQANNRRVGVTGALLFNGGYFAQVLEGPRPVVETTFERIQRDPRHSDVSVLQCEPVAERGFRNWSMAFIGQSARGRALWQEMANRTGFDLARIEGEQLFSTLHAIVLAEEGLTAEIQAVAPAPSASASRPETVRGKGEVLDIERLRAELRERIPEERPAEAADRRPVEVTGASPPGGTAEGGPDAGLGSEAAVLRAALDEERGRTTDLRRALDAARVALAVQGEQLETLRRHGEIWAGRAKALASALCHDPGLAEVPETHRVKDVA